MPPAIITLFLAAVCVGTTEFVIAGLLPEISADLAISIPVAGYLISAYAVGVAIGGPIITLALLRTSHKQSLLMLMAIFVAGHAWCVLAPDYWSLMAGRLIIALSHGSFYGIATVVAVGLVPQGKRGAAVAWIFAGATVANVLGVPGGTAIGNWLGWRATFIVVGGAGVLVALAMLKTLPANNSSTANLSSIRQQIFALRNQKVLLAYLLFGFSLIGFWAVFTFIAPLLLNITQVPSAGLPLMLLLFGLGATVGTMFGGRLADTHPKATLMAAFPLQMLTLLVLMLVSQNIIAMAAVLFLFGGLMFAPGPTLTNRILSGAAKAPELAATLMSTAANVGIALGAIIGAQALAAGASYADLPIIGMVFIAVSAGLAWLTLTLERN